MNFWQRNPCAQCRRARDTAGGTITYAYDALGNLIETDGPLPGTVDRIVTGYDPYGRTKLWLDDPDSGLWRYDYDAAGELVCQVDAKGQGILIRYDELGRKMARHEYTGVSLPPAGTPPDCQSGAHQGVSAWAYENNAQAPGFGQLRETRIGVTGAPWVRKTWTFDGFGRASELFTLIETGDNTGVYESFTESTTYDQYSRVFQQFDASGDFAGVRFHYNAQGYLRLTEEARTGPSGVDYQTILGADPWGHVTAERLGNGVTTHRGFDAAGRLETVVSTDPHNRAIQDLSYAYDTLGNVVKRASGVYSDPQPTFEVFTYDALNRLRGVYLTRCAHRCHRC